jgi:hypothetical protein
LEERGRLRVGDVLSAYANLDPEIQIAHAADRQLHKMTNTFAVDRDERTDLKSTLLECD